MKSITLFLAAIAFFVATVPAAAAPGTNAQRMALGLPPMAPRKLFQPTPALLAKRNTPSSTPGTSSSTSSTPSPPSSTSSTVIPPSSTSSTPIPPSSTSTTPIPPSSTSTTPVPPSSTSSTPVPPSSTSTTPVPPSSTSTTPAPPSSTPSTPSSTSSTPSSTPTGTPGSCSSGPIQCCDSVTTAQDPAAQAILGLLGIILGGDIPVGLTCSPLSIIGVGSSTCSANVVCCENNSYGGLISIGCIPIIL